MTPKTFLSIFLAAANVFASAAPAAAQFRTGAAPTGAVVPVHGAAAGHAPLAPQSLPTLSPALTGGAPTLGTLSPTLTAAPMSSEAALPRAIARSPIVAAAPSAVAPAAFAAPSLALPTRINAAPAKAGAAASVATPARTGVLATVTRFASAVARPGAGLAAAVSRFFFDGSKAAVNGVSRAGETYQPSFGADRLLPPGSSRTGLAPSNPGQPHENVVFRALKDGSDVRTHLPRTLVVSDVWAGAMPAADARRLQALVDQGVRLVLLTDRPDLGAGSADEELLSGLTPAAGNPIVIASYGGARISVVETAEGGKRWSTISEAGAFEPREVARFRAVAERVAHFAGTTVVPDASPFTFGLMMGAPDSKLESSRRGFIRRFNASLASSALPYRLRADAADPRRMVMRPFSQELALGRLAATLETRFGAAEGRETMLIVGDSLAKAASGDAVPAVLRGASLGLARGADAVSAQLGALTGEAPLPAEEASLSDLRQHIDFWLPRSAYTTEAPKRGKASAQGQFGLFTWKVLHGLLTDFYIDTARAGTKYTTLPKLLAALEARWNATSEDGALEKQRAGKSGRAASDEYLRHAKTYAANFWQREVGDYRLAQNEIRENLLTEGKVYTHVPLVSPFTGKVYDLGVSVDRVMTLDSAHGRELTATVYRFGREDSTDGDEANARAVALAVLRGYGRKGLDLRWRQQSVQGPRIGRVSVQIEYLRTSRSFAFEPEELLAIEGDGTITQGPETLKLAYDVELAQNDAAFQKSLEDKDRPAKAPAPAASEWSLRGAEIRRMFAQYFPALQQSSRLRPFPSEADALRQRPAEETGPDVLAEPLRWPAPRGGETVAGVDAAVIEDAVAAPRVVFIHDMFTGPASEATVAAIQKLVDLGSHLVFMTRRESTGPDSADEVLLKRLKVGRTNPIIVASRNGGRVALHSRAKEPKAFIEDAPAPAELSVARVLQALDTRFKGEDLLSEPEKFLVLADTKGSPKLAKAFPKSVTFRSAAGDAQLVEQVNVILGDRRLKAVGVKLGEIRQWDDFWEPQLLRKAGQRFDGSQSQDAWDSDRGYHGPLAMFTGSLFYRLMPELMEKVWRGQDRQTTLAQGQERLRQMWHKPVQNGVFVSKKQAALMKDPGWKTRSRGYLDRALTLFSKIYERIFEDYAAAADDIMHNLAGLTTDRQSLITLPFKVGNKLYKVFTRLPRLMKRDTPDGRVLSVVAYRTGKEPFEGDGDSVYAKTLAMSMLVGFAQPAPDGTWRDGWAQGPAIAKLHVRFEYKSGGVDLYFEPNDFFQILPNGKLRQGRIVQEIANTIERMRNDEEFQAHYKAEVEEATAEELKTPKAKAVKKEGKK